MKIYISADIEGITGVTNWDETELNKPDFAFAQEQMTAEVIAACEGALQAGATELLVKDAHDTARNIIAARLPQEARLVRGWSGHPYMMMQELDETFAGAALIGYHSGVGSPHSPLSHTVTTVSTGMRINDLPASEFLINSYTAATLKVPVIFVAGDRGLCEEAERLVPGIRTVAVKSGDGRSTTNLHPALAASRIRQAVADAVGHLSEIKPIALPTHFHVEISYKEHANARRNSFYPGARSVDAQTIAFDADDWFEVLRLILFVM